VNVDVHDIDVIFMEETDAIANPLGVKGLGETGVVGLAPAIAGLFSTRPASASANCRSRWTRCCEAVGIKTERCSSHCRKTLGPLDGTETDSCTESGFSLKGVLPSSASSVRCRRSKKTANGWVDPLKFDQYRTSR
jgi:hypothetical protein